MFADSITPFAFESMSVRGALIHMSRSWRRMQRDHDYPTLIAETLGHAAAATGLIAQSLKFDGSITLQLQGSETLQMLVMQCSSDMHLRGMAIANDEATASNFEELLGNARCAITVDSGERPYQGVVAIEGDSLAASLEHYFDRSVQVPSHVALLADKKLAGGILLQQMPGQPVDADDWNRLQFIVRTLARADFDNDTAIDLLRKLFAEDDVRVHEPRQVGFQCRCSRQKVEEVLKMLGEQESRDALSEQGEIEVVCEYCGRRQQFDAVDLTRLFADNAVHGPKSVQ
tara:strand:+ start:859 stop:1719 length:861 start_codon:yes stop_codon:yes gene_type:complete